MIDPAVCGCQNEENGDEVKADSIGDNVLGRQATLDFGLSDKTKLINESCDTYLTSRPSVWLHSTSLRL